MHNCFEEEKEIMKLIMICKDIEVVSESDLLTTAINS